MLRLCFGAMIQVLKVKSSPCKTSLMQEIDAHLLNINHTTVCTFAYLSLLVVDLKYIKGKKRLTH